MCLPDAGCVVQQRRWRRQTHAGPQTAILSPPRSLLLQWFLWRVHTVRTHVRVCALAQAGGGGSESASAGWTNASSSSTNSNSAGHDHNLRHVDGHEYSLYYSLLSFVPPWSTLSLGARAPHALSIHTYHYINNTHTHTRTHTRTHTHTHAHTHNTHTGGNGSLGRIMIQTTGVSKRDLKYRSKRNIHV